MPEPTERKRLVVALEFDVEQTPEAQEIFGDLSNMATFLSLVLMNADDRHPHSFRLAADGVTVYDNVEDLVADESGDFGCGAKAEPQEGSRGKQEGR